MRTLRDLSLSAAVAGFVAVLVGFTSSAVIVFEAARAAGADAAETASWLWALGVGVGGATIVLSLRYRMPILLAWSTPGAALLITSTAGLPLSETIGAFILTGLLITALGLSGLFDRVMRQLPGTLAAAMLAGVLLRFGLEAFGAMEREFLLVAAMFGGFLVARQRAPRYAVVVALLVGMATAAAQGMFGDVRLTPGLTEPRFVLPALSWAAAAGVALPLFVVTMASQNVPGVATLHAHGYRPPLRPVIALTGLVTAGLAPFGGFTINLAAITAAITMGKEAHPDQAKRYHAAVFAGALYVVVGLFAGTVTAAFAAFPRELVVGIAGLALLGTIGNGLAVALHDEREREAALVTFLVTASGLTLGSVGSAFWGLAAGLLVVLTQRSLRRTPPTAGPSDEGAH